MYSTVSISLPLENRFHAGLIENRSALWEYSGRESLSMFGADKIRTDKLKRTSGVTRRATVVEEQIGRRKIAMVQQKTWDTETIKY